MRFASVSALAGLIAPAAFAVGPGGDVRTACLDRLPEEVRAASPADALEGQGSFGRWWITAGEMDGAGAAEAVLVWLPAGKKGKVHFVAPRPDDQPKVKEIKLKGAPLADASVSFVEYGAGRSLLHVNGGESGQALLSWDGNNLRDVWKVGKTRPDETRWFELEDLDADGAREVIVYVRRDLGAMDEDLDLGESGADQRITEQVDPVAVYRLDDGRWKRSGDLLESLR